MQRVNVFAWPHTVLFSYWTDKAFTNPFTENKTFTGNELSVSTMTDLSVDYEYSYLMIMIIHGLRGFMWTVILQYADKMCVPWSTESGTEQVRVMVYWRPVSGAYQWCSVVLVPHQRDLSLHCLSVLWSHWEQQRGRGRSVDHCSPVNFISLSHRSSHCLCTNRSCCSLQ